MKLLWLDLETTCLDPRKGAILEVGAFLTPFERPWLAVSTVPHFSAVMPYVPTGLEPLDDNVREMHTKSGLLTACLKMVGRERYPVALTRAENTLVELLSSESVVHLAGCGVHFDLAWLRIHMPRLAALVHYRVYDVSAAVLFCCSLGMPAPSEDKPHRALADLSRAVGLARDCAMWLGLVDSPMGEC